MDFIDHEFISKHLGDFFAKSSIITIIIDVPRTARALLAVKNHDRGYGLWESKYMGASMSFESVFKGTFVRMNMNH